MFYNYSQNRKYLNFHYYPKYITNLFIFKKLKTRLTIWLTDLTMTGGPRTVQLCLTSCLRMEPSKLSRMKRVLRGRGICLPCVLFSSPRVTMWSKPVSEKAMLSEYVWFGDFLWLLFIEINYGRFYFWIIFKKCI